MKKNKMMRVASTLLVAVLLTTCAISGTYAKYVTSGSASDSARVAKFGVVITAQTGSAFATEYKAKSEVKNADGTVITNTVVSSNSDKLVAPGTAGELAAFSMTGTPEVAVAVKYDVTMSLTNWGIASGEYCPIIFTVDNVDYYINKTTINDVAGLINAVEEAVEGFSANYPALTDLSTLDEDAPSISWRWEFESDTLGEYQTDGKDTELGNIAARNIAGAGKIELNVVCSVTQID